MQLKVIGLEEFQVLVPLALSRLACGGFCCGFECHLSYSVEKNLAEVKFSACGTVQLCCVGTGLN